jgi:tetratricopeptide (TPR) repeat protein
MRKLLPVLMAATVASAAAAQTIPNRESARIQNRLAWEHMKVEAWEKAAGMFRQAISLDPTYEYAYYGLGRANMAMKKYVEAIAALEKCGSLYRAEAGRRFANAQEAQRYRRDRIMEIDDQIRQVQSMPQSAKSADQLRQLQNLRRLEQDRIQRGNNMDIDATVPAYVSLSLGSAYFRAGKLGDAEREYKAAIAADAKAGEAHSNLAVVYLETGRLSEAEKAVRAAERAGYKIHPQLKQDIKERARGGA